MKISDLLIENDLRNVPLVTIGDQSVTVGDIQDIVPDSDPQTIMQNASKIKSLVDKYGEDALTAASLIPYVRYGLAARAGVMGLGKAIGQSELTKVAGKEVAKRVDILPDKSDNSPRASDVAPAKKKKKYNVGEKIPVTVANKTHQLPVKNVLPSGYEVDASGVPGRKPGETMTVPEPI